MSAFCFLLSLHLRLFICLVLGGVRPNSSYISYSYLGSISTYTKGPNEKIVQCQTHSSTTNCAGEKPMRTQSMQSLSLFTKHSLFCVSRRKPSSAVSLGVSRPPGARGLFFILVEGLSRRQVVQKGSLQGVQILSENGVAS